MSLKYEPASGYYVPLAVFLRADHPQNPPVCIVTPTPDMMIKPNHNHVDVQVPTLPTSTVLKQRSFATWPLNPET